MHFPLLTAALALLSASASVVLAEPIAIPIPYEPVDDAPAEAAEAPVLDKRGDNWCRVTTPLYCRKGPGTNYAKVKVEGRDKISTSKNFGVRCTKEGSSVYGETTWDYIPGWNCYASAYYTRSAGSQRYCESGLPRC